MLYHFHIEFWVNAETLYFSDKEDEIRSVNSEVDDDEHLNFEHSDVPKKINKTSKRNAKRVVVDANDVPPEELLEESEAKAVRLCKRKKASYTPIAFLLPAS